MNIKKPLHTVVVKTVGSKCNLDCDYCFYLNKEMQYKQENKMDDATQTELIRQLLEQSGNAFGIVWQGGEPSLAGTDFFEKAIKNMISCGECKNKNISNMMQTNGFHLSDDLISLMQDYSFLTGLSIDGPQEIHDFYRKTPNGKGSCSQAMQSWYKLKQAGVETNILCCVTDLSAKQPDRLYNFFKVNEMSWLKFIPVSEFDDNLQLKKFSVSPKLWGEFMCRIFDLWFADFSENKSAPNIRFIENAFQMHLGMPSPECTYLEECGVYQVIEHNGDVFSCDFLVGKETYLGNIHQSKLIEMLNSEKNINFGKAKKNRHTDCESCRWLKFCYGGCPKYRNPETQQYHFCESWKMFLNHSESRFKMLVDSYRQNNPAFKGGTLDVSGMF